MVKNCKVNSVLKKCIKKRYSIKVAQRYLKIYYMINLSDEVLLKRHKLLMK
jgi:hypothetical protein